MSEKIEPALTAEEWAKALSWPHGIEDYIIEPAEEMGYGQAPGAIHRVAALALYGQPFGFTREDVTQLRKRAANCRESERWAADQMYPDKIRDAREAAELYESLADRIEALLPPA